MNVRVDRKNHTEDHRLACRVMINCDPEGQIYLSHPYTNVGFFFLVTIKYGISILKRLINIKKEGKDQKSTQSSTTPDPGHQWESDNFTIRHHK